VGTAYGLKVVLLGASWGTHWDHWELSENPLGTSWELNGNKKKPKYLQIRNRKRRRGGLGGGTKKAPM